MKNLKVNYKIMNILPHLIGLNNNLKLNLFNKKNCFYRTSIIHKCCQSIFKIINAMNIMNLFHIFLKNMMKAIFNKKINIITIKMIF